MAMAKSVYFCDVGQPTCEQRGPFVPGSPMFSDQQNRCRLVTASPILVSKFKFMKHPDQISLSKSDSSESEGASLAIDRNATQQSTKPMIKILGSKPQFHYQAPKVLSPLRIRKPKSAQVSVDLSEKEAATQLPQSGATSKDSTPLKLLELALFGNANGQTTSSPNAELPQTEKEPGCEGQEISEKNSPMKSMDAILRKSLKGEIEMNLVDFKKLENQTRAESRHRSILSKRPSSTASLGRKERATFSSTNLDSLASAQKKVTFSKNLVMFVYKKD